ncbi:TPA: cupin domain-containing protein [Staphylococcus aureus]|nr:cupin domain-containing protein [Staphylococcus aureus]MRX26382.1 cupin domain-containing protein [Staphylococcus aureus]HCV9034639.1 cupin domain-containing protein [Staphylococcus aureus]HCV9037224.1 cupin domain-containing protein [Staphylococcus aureus]HCW7355559.1 cupin domain-containing protein [Staphylococcus aureus]
MEFQGELMMDYNIRLKILKSGSEKLEEEVISFNDFYDEQRQMSQVHWLYRDTDSRSASAAIVHYKKGGYSPEHFHTGFELIYMLEGEMETSQGKVRSGEIIYFDPETSHSFYTNTGCIALITWGATVVPSKERTDLN